jgi:hypothetical protein
MDGAALLLIGIGLTAAPNSAIVPSGAELAIVTPNLAGFARDAKSFLSVAGSHAPLLTPATLSRDFFPGFPDVLDPKALDEAGFDTEKAAAFYRINRSHFLSIAVRDAATAKTTLGTWLAAAGVNEKALADGFTGAVDGAKIRRAYRRARRPLPRGKRGAVPGEHASRRSSHRLEHHHETARGAEIW